MTEQEFNKWYESFMALRHVDECKSLGGEAPDYPLRKPTRRQCFEAGYLLSQQNKE